MITVIGSVNLDLVASGAPLPHPGETVTGARLARYPGGKGANQALAAARLGQRVRLVAAVGDDDMAEEALKLLRAGGVDLSATRSLNGETTGVALIAVSPEGENLIVVCPGANNALTPGDVEDEVIGNMMGVLEVPVPVLLAAARKATGLVALNLAPALPVPDALLAEAGLLVVNETEAAFYGAALHAPGRRVAVSLGSEGAELWLGGKKIAAAKPPKIRVVDTVGAGDTFFAALTTALIEGMPDAEALTFAVAAGAAACTKPGAQPSLPTRAEVEALLRG
ncbi:MAG: ribokinase [Hyphomonas sp.]|uniref:ribokinase n=1 Tax=Hyphomonas sp. TaxID=87 RepID=UPI0017C1A19B|nr:ribokinase [Hyphomonas sp.]MBA3067424.1 ribokinase [Hyphomonas sp.]MBU3920301.1 ribokinase [Alphaproteobacteria bacterium]MBU4061024.1 ribokinase [Alphaproteobacteria bacterium]MBU4165880.1 ribokinase [Alphaproteobacteria bacterium]